MKKLGISAALAGLGAAVLAASALAGSAAAAKVVPFTAKYSGTAVVKVTDDVADITATGTGTGTLIGKSTLSGKGKGDTSARPCVPFTGPGQIVGSGGTKLFFTVAAGSSGCGDEAGEVFSLSGRIKVTKGTGKLAKARGTLKFTGVYDRKAGTFSVKFTGSLTV